MYRILTLLALLIFICNLSRAQCDLNRYKGDYPSLETNREKIVDYGIGEDGVVSVFSSAYVSIKDKGYSNIKLQIITESEKSVAVKPTRIYFANDEIEIGRIVYAQSDIIEKNGKAFVRSTFRLHNLVSKEGLGSTTLSYSEIESITLNSEKRNKSFLEIEIKENSEKIVSQIKCINSVISVEK